MFSFKMSREPAATEKPLPPPAADTAEASAAQTAASPTAEPALAKPPSPPAHSSTSSTEDVLATNRRRASEMYQRAAHAEQEYLARKRVAAARGQWTASRQHFSESGKQLKAGVEAMWTCVRATPYLAKEWKLKTAQKIDERKRAKAESEEERGGRSDGEGEPKTKTQGGEGAPAEGTRAGDVAAVQDDGLGDRQGGHETSGAKNGAKGKDAA